MATALSLIDLPSPKKPGLSIHELVCGATVVLGIDSVVRGVTVVLGISILPV